MMGAQGRLFVFDSATRCVAFEFGEGVIEQKTLTSSVEVLLFIGGLTDGLLGLSYLPELASALRSELGIPLIQIQPRSAFLGYGTHRLDDAVHDMVQLMKHLNQTKGWTRFGWMGHSTGCQDIIHLLSTKGNTFDGLTMVLGVLQGPVSDREYFVNVTTANNPEDRESWMQQARSLVQKGRDKELMPREVDYAPIEAGRFMSLFQRNGLEDMFSTDLD
eukprot:Colp12_sorted_trinity150504_noHs@11322